MSLILFILSLGLIAVPSQQFEFIDNAIGRGLLNALCLAKDTSIPSNSVDKIGSGYDFVIIGAGAAGSVLANRLTTLGNGTWSVLVLSGGQRESLLGKIPIFTTLLQFTDYNSAYKSEPTQGACLGMKEGRCALAEGKAVGGSTAINYMTYIRGSKLDYNQWADYVEDPSWGYTQVLPLYKKLEKVALKRYDVAYHSTTGEMIVGDSYKSKVTEAFINSAVELGESAGDYNGERRTFSTLQATLKKGRRFSAAKAFLAPVRGKPNLLVLTEAPASRIIFAGKKAAFVEFSKNGKTYRVVIKKEVILAAGALDTPQILMKSGVGPQNVLNKAGIPVVADLSVGKNLCDQLVYTGLGFTMNKTEEHLLNVFNPIEGVKFLANGEGLLTSLGGFEAVGFINTNVTNNTDYDVALFFSGLGSYNTDKGFFNRKAIRLTDKVYNEFYRPLEGKPSCTIFPILLKPISRGSMSLNSGKPIFNMNYLSNSLDIQTLIAAIRYVQRLVKAKPFQYYNATLTPFKVPSCKDPYDSDAYWNCALTVLSTSAFKYSGTCKMGPLTDSSAVVGSNMKIHTLDGVRVIDASAIPFGITGDIYTTEMMMGQKAADLIVKYWTT